GGSAREPCDHEEPEQAQRGAPGRSRGPHATTASRTTLDGRRLIALRALLARGRRGLLFLFLGRGLRRALGLSLLFLLGIAGLEHHRAAIDDLVLAFELERSRNADHGASRCVTQGHLVFASEVAVAAGDL